MKDLQSLGELLEGKLYKDKGDGCWKIAIEKDSAAINLEKLFKRYEGKEVRVTLVDLDNADEIARRLKNLMT